MNDKGEKWAFLSIGCVFVVLFGFVVATAGTRPQVGWGLFIVVAGVVGIFYSLLRLSDEIHKGG